MFYVYVLKSGKDDNLYIGFTSDLKKRLSEHNEGKNISTSSRRPFKLVYYEAYLDAKDARNRESRLKKRGQARVHLKNRIYFSIEKNDS